MASSAARLAAALATGFEALATSSSACLVASAIALSDAAFASALSLSQVFCAEAIRVSLAINVKMLNLLLVCMSMCFGGALITQFEPEKRAPYRAFIGTGSTIKAGVLLDGFSAFYENYHNLLDSFAAFEAMKKATIDSSTGKSPFWMMTSEDVFQKTLDPDRDPDNFKHIVNEQYVKQKVEGKDVTWEQVANEIRDLLTETDTRYYENYTYRDLIPNE